MGAVMSKEKHRQSEPPTHEDDPLLNIAEVARQIGKSPNTVKNWIIDGLLKGIRLPSGLWNVRKSQVNEILRASEIDKQVK